MWVYGAGSGLITGALLALWLNRLIPHEREALSLPAATGAQRRLRSGLVILVTTVLFAAFTWAEMSARWLDISEVQPSDLGRCFRLGYHLVLVALLIAATVIDLDCYMIPDAITRPGALFGILAAMAVGELQIAHLWVDWGLDPLALSLHGPYIPQWFDRFRWLHAFGWSVAGLLAGAGLTQLVRVVSSRLLGQEAMGFGDVTLMAMVGSFLGWQATVLTFLLAPLFGLILAIPGQVLLRKPYLPYGPYLSLAAVTVLFAWGALWRQTRVIFSDFLGLFILGSIAAVALIGLLTLVRLYRSIPVRRSAPVNRNAEVNFSMKAAEPVESTEPDSDESDKSTVSSSEAEPD